ncbi:MAG: cupin domain-containing protein [Candidatus Latescibacter sp.]|nr:cupin domain-containing protein [Candidatus Latescibacter sp.]
MKRIFLPLTMLILWMFWPSPSLAEQKGKPIYWSLVPSTYKDTPKCHSGAGTVKLSPIYGTPDFATNLRAISRGEIPPQCSIGEHVHRGIEEIFIILNANAQFTVNGHTAELPPRAMVVCQKGSSHGIYNPNSDVSLDWLYFAVSMVKNKWDSIDFVDDLSQKTLESPPPFQWTLLDRRLLKSATNAHGGKGTILFRRCFDKNSFATNWEFIDHCILPPGTSIGYHQHNMIEEVYYLVSGSGKVTVNNVTWEVKAGDAIPCTIYDSHGLYNNSNGEIELVVVSAALEKGKRNEKDLGDDLSTR